ncbi:transmembrane proteins 14C-domain-containing protein [Sphaerosporella brunnea]|uniref:Transmembrane proteins 14C-domain-containing protein n=1 Tax=Sphaerosporella brunnea TaxID=1250544 RepID=A0A5J5EW71_9PEZI|nr:transmembrane proteins 14C-domain-containing protein [Sphaerosporella brunnea]
MSDIPAFILGCLCAFGGTMGYLRTGSVPSIAAGLTVGALYNYGGYRIRHNQAYGVETALLASLILAGSSFPRALKTQKPLPIGLSVLAAYGLFYYGAQWSRGGGGGGGR